MKMARCLMFVVAALGLLASAAMANKMNDPKLKISVVGDHRIISASGGREGEESRPLVVLTDQDRERSYVLHWGQAKAPFQPIWPAELVLGADEWESIELGVLALSELGTVELSVQSTPALPQGAVQVRTQQGVSNAGADLKWENYALVPGRELELVRGDHKSFWITLDTRKIPPGRYALQLAVQPQQAPGRQVSLVLEVLEARRLADEELTLVMYHTASYIHDYGLDQQLQLMHKHYQRQLMLHFPFNS